MGQTPEQPAQPSPLQPMAQMTSEQPMAQTPEQPVQPSLQPVPLQPMAQPAKEVTSQPSLEFELTMGVPAIGMQLQNLNMPHLVDAFRMEGVDAATLQGADKNDLVELKKYSLPSWNSSTLTSRL